MLRHIAGSGLSIPNLVLGKVEARAVEAMVQA
jgi:hypothetical protein